MELDQATDECCVHLTCVDRVRDLESVPDMLQQKSVKQVGCKLTLLFMI
jgi:hypothetical protein